MADESIRRAVVDPACLQVFADIFGMNADAGSRLYAWLVKSKTLAAQTGCGFSVTTPASRTTTDVHNRQKSVKGTRIPLLGASRSTHTRLCLRAAACLAISAAALAAQDAPRIRLVESSSLHVPPGIEVSGASLSRDDALIFWSRDEGAVWRAKGRTTTRLCSSLVILPIAAAFVSSEEGIEFVDGLTGNVINADGAGSCRPTRRLAPADSLIAASYSSANNEWFALTIAAKP